MPHKYQTNRPLAGNITTPLRPQLGLPLNRNSSAVGGGILYYKLPFVILTLIENPTSNSHWRVLLCGQSDTTCWSLSFVMWTVRYNTLKP